MNYVKVAQTADLASGGKMRVSVSGKEILLTNIKGTFYAVDNVCPHMGGLLADGKLEGSRIVCPKHGSTFDVTTGKFVSPGKFLFVKVHTHDLKSYPVKVEGTDVLVGIE